MAKRTYTIKSTEGLHARLTTTLCKIANQYDNDSYIIYKTHKINLKSVIGVMSLGIAFKETFTIEVEGENTTTILNDFETLLKQSNII